MGGSAKISATNNQFLGKSQSARDQNFRLKLKQNFVNKGTLVEIVRSVGEKKLGEARSFGDRKLGEARSIRDKRMGEAIEYAKDIKEGIELLRTFPNPPDKFIDEPHRNQILGLDQENTIKFEHLYTPKMIQKMQRAFIINGMFNQLVKTGIGALCFVASPVALLIGTGASIGITIYEGKEFDAVFDGARAAGDLAMLAVATPEELGVYHRFIGTNSQDAAAFLYLHAKNQPASKSRNTFLKEFGANMKSRMYRIGGETWTKNEIAQNFLETTNNHIEKRDNGWRAYISESDPITNRFRGKDSTDKLENFTQSLQGKMKQTIDKVNEIKTKKAGNDEAPAGDTAEKV